MSQVDRVEHDLARLPEHLREGADAGVALSMARILDGEGRGSASECARVLLEALATLRELAPPEEKKGELHGIKSGRALRLAAGGPGT